jgi:hypothetical protein
MPGLGDTEPVAEERPAPKAAPAVTPPGPLPAPTPVARPVAAPIPTSDTRITAEPTSKPTRTSEGAKKTKRAQDTSDEDETPQRPYRLQCNITARADALVEAGKQELRQRGLRGHDASITVVVENALEIAYGSLVTRGRR